MTDTDPFSRELTSRSDGLPALEDFTIEGSALPPAGPGDVQVRNLWMSSDPRMSDLMNDTPSHGPAFQIHEVLQGGAVGEIMVSLAEDLTRGDLVQSMFGWRETFNTPTGRSRCGRTTVCRATPSSRPPEC